MKVAITAEMFQKNPYSGIAVWARRLQRFLEAGGTPCDIFSYDDVSLPFLAEKIKNIANFREFLVYPEFGKILLPELEKKYDIINLLSPYTIADYKSRKPTVVTVQYLVGRQNRNLERRLPAKYKVYFNPATYHLFQWQERRGLANADMITVVRRDYVEYLTDVMKLPAERIFYVPNAIDTDFFVPNENGLAEEAIAVFVGRGSRAKGFHTLLKAAPKIKGKIVAVMSKAEKSLKDLAESLPNVEVRMQLNAEELRQVHQSAKVFVMPSLTEGNPISTLEAMSCGLPVVCTDEGSGNNIEEGKNGYLFDFNDADTLADRVNYLFEQNSIAREFAAKNRKQVEENNSLTGVTKNMLSIYKKIN
ncbi:glycosyltransferase family 4 protein [bacterium]|nr:glycosyltransferase family 4 protein [bacterium]